MNCAQTRCTNRLGPLVSGSYFWYKCNRLVEVRGYSCKQDACSVQCRRWRDCDKRRTKNDEIVLTRWKWSNLARRWHFCRIVYGAWRSCAIHILPADVFTGVVVVLSIYTNGAMARFLVQRLPKLRWHGNISQWRSGSAEFLDRVSFFLYVCGLSNAVARKICGVLLWSVWNTVFEEAQRIAFSASVKFFYSICWSSG